MRGSPTVVTCAALLVVAASFGTTFAAARVDGGPTGVVVTLTDSKIGLVPASVPAGPVVFRVVNRGHGARDFKIAGKRTSPIAAGKSATLNANVTTGKTWVYYSAGQGPATTLDGVLLVVAASCTAPRTSTVTVQLLEAPMKVSRSTVPCGTVNFVVTNAGTAEHSFRITNPGGGAVAPGGLSPTLQPGQTASLTVHFTTKGRALYYCGETECAETYGATGYLTVD